MPTNNMMTAARPTFKRTAMIVTHQRASRCHVTSRHVMSRHVRHVTNVNYQLTFDEIAGSQSIFNVSLSTYLPGCTEEALNNNSPLDNN